MRGFNKCVTCGRWCNSSSFNTTGGTRVYHCPTAACNPLTPVNANHGPILINIRNRTPYDDVIDLINERILQCATT